MHSWLAQLRTLIFFFFWVCIELDLPTHVRSLIFIEYFRNYIILASLYWECIEGSTWHQGKSNWEALFNSNMALDKRKFMSFSGKEGLEKNIKILWVARADDYQILNSNHGLGYTLSLKTSFLSRFKQGSVLPSIHVLKAHRPCKTSEQIFLWCGKGKRPTALMWSQAHPNRALPTCLESFLGSTLHEVAHNSVLSNITSRTCAYHLHSESICMVHVTIIIAIVPDWA